MRVRLYRRPTERCMYQGVIQMYVFSVYSRLWEPCSPDIPRQGGAGSLRPDRDPHHPDHAQLPGPAADAALYPGQQMQTVLGQATGKQGVEHGSDRDAGTDHSVHPPSLRLQLLRGLDGPGGALLLLRYSQYYRIWRLYSRYSCVLIYSKRDYSLTFMAIY